MTERLLTRFLIIHNSAIESISDLEEDFKLRGYNKIGYQEIIQPDGTVESGETFPDIFRTDDEVGAHAFDVDNISIGLCWLGSGSIAPNQFAALVSECIRYMQKYPDITLDNVVGHNELPNANTTCPRLNMPFLRATIKQTIEMQEGKAIDVARSIIENKFADLPMDYWAYEELLWAIRESKLMQGIVEDGKLLINPDKPMTRAELAVVLKRFHDAYIR